VDFAVIAIPATAMVALAAFVVMQGHLWQLATYTPAQPLTTVVPLTPAPVVRNLVWAGAPESVQFPTLAAIDQARLDVVWAALEHERQARLDSIGVIVMPEPMRVTG